jgi:biotin carboxyl carrier protein
VADRTVTLRDEGGRLCSATQQASGAVRVEGLEIAISAAADGSLVVSGRERRTVWTAVSRGVCWVFIDGEVFTFEVDQPVRRRIQRAADQGPIEAPMPATVRHIAVAPGDQVSRGDVLLVLEAMKMELPIRANGDGLVEAVRCREGELVQAGQELVRLG